MPLQSSRIMVFEKIRKIFTPVPRKQNIPSFIELNVDPLKYWTALEDIGEGSFGAVKKVSSKDEPALLAAYKVIF